MNAIDEKLKQLKIEKRLGLMTHVVVGYPSLEKTYTLVNTMAKSGADFIELQIPFSDPLADGPTIMRACEKALEQGVKVADAFKLARKLKPFTIPLLFMAYFNTVFKYGVEKFYTDAKKAGISGLIVPDMSLEEEKEEYFLKFARKSSLFVIRVLSPASTPERLKKNSLVAQGFVYFTARQGITDAKKEIDPKIVSYLKRARKYFRVPLAVGFGISDKKRLSQIAPYADIAVIGSAIIDVINQSENNSIEKNVKDFLTQLLRYNQK